MYVYSMCVRVDACYLRILRMKSNSLGKPVITIEVSPISLGPGIFTGFHFDTKKRTQFISSSLGKEAVLLKSKSSTKCLLNHLDIDSISIAFFTLLKMRHHFNAIPWGVFHVARLLSQNEMEYIDGIHNLYT